MKDNTLTTNCPDCGVDAGETCLPDCPNDDSFKEPSEITRLRTQLAELQKAVQPFADERRIVAPSADPNTDPAVVVSLAELERLRRALAPVEGKEEGHKDKCWPQFPDVHSRPIVHEGRRGIVYCNLGQKTVYFHFDWRNDLPQYGIELLGPEGKIREVFRPELYNNQGGIEVSFCLPPGQYLAAIEKTTPAERGEDDAHSH